MTVKDSKLKIAVLGLSLLASVGCNSENPDANIEAPIITSDAPTSSDEAAAQAQGTEKSGRP